MKRLLGLAMVAGVVVSPAVLAHEFVCDKTINGLGNINISRFPATVPYLIRITNTHPTETSVLLDAEDDLLSTEGYEFSRTLPFAVGVGQFIDETFDLEIDSYEECLRFAARDGVQDDFIVNVYRIAWDSGETQCTARVGCDAPIPPPPSGATRTLGFFRTHISATQQCLAGGPVDLGFVTITTIADAMGLMWGSPNEFGDETDRNDLERFRFLLGRQTFVGICNQRLFGTDPDPTDLLTDAVAELATTDCDAISGLIDDVDDFNNSGDDEPFPVGFVPGPATPRAAQALADDPTSPGGEDCGD